MACYSPIKGYRKKDPNPTGKYGFTICPKQGNTAHPMTIPCGYCIGCRLERSRQWAIRCMHEAKSHEKNCFITLTYNNENLPKNGTLIKRHFQLFMKKLRKEYQNETIRYYHCGEYGAKMGRPHYHACIFGFDFPDKTPWTDTLYVSKKLETLWGMGFTTIGTVTFESAAYVARYILKKQYGKTALEHYTNFDKQTGEIKHELTPEYTTMSRRPGIATEWYEKYKHDVYPTDKVIVRARKMRPPRFYDKKLQKENEPLFNEIKLKRKIKAIKNSIDNTDERLKVKERITILTYEKLTRSYEHETV